MSAAPAFSNKTEHEPEAQTNEVKDHFQERREQLQNEPKKEQSHETIETYWGMDGKRRTHLKNGAEVQINAVNVPAFLDQADSRLKDADMALAGKVGKELGESAAVQEIDGQLQEGKVEGNMVSILARVFREFGNDIYSIPPEGIDMSKLGNQIDIHDKTLYLIPEARADEMKKKLEDLSTSTGEVSGAFHIQNYRTINPEEGFEAVYTYTNKNGVEVKAQLVFFYAHDGQKEKEAEINSDNATEQSSVESVNEKAGNDDEEVTQPEKVSA